MLLTRLLSAAGVHFCVQCQARLATDEMQARDAASLLSSLAALNHTPPETWLHVCLNVLYWRLQELDSEGLASVPISLAKLSVIVSNGPFLDTYISMTTARLAAMHPETQVRMLQAHSRGRRGKRNTGREELARGAWRSGKGAGQPPKPWQNAAVQRCHLNAGIEHHTTETVWLGR